MTVAEQQMYGMSVADIRDQFGWMLLATGAEMTAVSVLSDAQEIMARGDAERARKWINIAKFILIDQMKQKQKEAA